MWQVHVQRIPGHGVECAQLLLPLRQRGCSLGIRRAFEQVQRPAGTVRFLVQQMRDAFSPPPRNFKIFEAAPQNERGAPAKKPPPDYFL
jgi:hypothetical protein